MVIGEGAGNRTLGSLGVAQQDHRFYNMFLQNVSFWQLHHLQNSSLAQKEIEILPLPEIRWSSS